MRSPDDDPSEGGLFDRTIFLKTNMQLSTETMRSSLDADWKMLSDDAKKKLIDTSMYPRPVEQQMIDEIQRADNPSRCSCAQLAPEELKSDPDCCARGIELVFTWRKNGNLEVGLKEYVAPHSGLRCFSCYRFNVASIEWTPFGYLSSARHWLWNLL